MSTTSSRMLALLSLLQARRDWPGGVLAERLDVTPRTVRRDIERLRALGYVIDATKGPDGGYRLAAGSELPPLLFDDEQAVAIAIALQSVPATGVDVAEAAARALATVRQVMPSRLRHRIDGIRFTDAAATGTVAPAVLEAVSAATEGHRILRFDYRDELSRRAEPHAVVARGGRWYLIAWDLDAGEWRIFRLDRLTPRIPLGAEFVRRPIPHGDAAAFLSARAKGSDRPERWPVYGEMLLEVPLRDAAPWLGDAEAVAVADGACRVRVGSWSWAGVLSWVLRFDAPFTVLGPPEFATAAGALAARVADAATGGVTRE